MSHSLSEDENLIAEDQSPFCDGFAEKNDLIFSYPIEFINKTHAYTIASTLQQAMNYLKSVTNLKPTEKLRSRVIIRWIKERDLTGKSIWKSEKDKPYVAYIETGKRSHQEYRLCAKYLLISILRLKAR